MLAEKKERNSRRLQRSVSERVNQMRLASECRRNKDMLIPEILKLCYEPVSKLSDSAPAETFGALAKAETDAFVLEQINQRLYAGDATKDENKAKEGDTLERRL